MARIQDIARTLPDRRATAIALLTLVLGVATTIWAYGAVRGADRARAREQFAHYSAQAFATIKGRFAEYTTLVRSGQAVFAGSDAVSRREWADFVATLELSGNYPGINGLAFIQRVPAAQRAGFLRRTRADGAPGFAIRPPGDREIYCPITYMSPAGNEGDLGFDVCTAPTPERTLAEARDRGEVVISPRLSLARSDGPSERRRGVIIVAPVYRNGAVVDTVAARREAITGWVGAPLPINRIVGRVIPPNAHVRLQIFEKRPDGGEDLLFDSAAGPANGAPPAPVDDATELVAPMPLRLANRDWRLVFSGPLQRNGSQTLVLGGGLTITLLLSILLLNLGRTRSRALALADEMTFALRESEQLLSSITDNIFEGIYRGEMGRGVIYCNHALARMFGYQTSDEMLGVAGPILYADPGRRDQLRALLEKQGYYKNEEVEYIRSDGSHFIGVNNAVAVHDANGNVLYYDGAIYDITERKQAEEQVHRLAHYDSLTDLPNRMLLRDRMSQGLSHVRRNGTKLAVLFLDLDRFKTVNDSLGHDIGDELLRTVARRLASVLRTHDTVSRQGGDEFVIVVLDVQSRQDVARVAAKLLEVVAQPYDINGEELHITPSVGISLYPDDGTEIETLIRNADAAMYQAKENGRFNFQFFTQDMSTVAMERLSLENSLRQALDRDEFVLRYQPQVSLSTGEIIGVEALIRWNHPKRGMVPPGDFIPLAEQTGLIVPIGEWVLATACRDNQAWRMAGLPALPVSVNLSAIQFRRRNLHRVIAGILAETGLPPELLELEVTESVVMHESHDAQLAVSRLNELGIRLAIDDFGTGYSSLGYIKRFRIDRLKIDQSFVRDAPRDPEDAAICRAIIMLAHSLRLQVIAEGVETEEQVAFLRDHQCDAIQGFCFSRPLPADDYRDLLAGGRRLGEMIS
ncbi:MAG: EAL domain-containing protein [Gammaproteobacteria bacterium]|jgi:diguanylate cyclase (GGDEF)-like protein/PAS domain S-box-containing protein